MSDGNNNFADIEDVILVCITTEINMGLVSKVSNKEVLEELGQMDLRKAPGIDCLFGLFYKKNCDVMGGDVLHMCEEILNSNRG